MRGMNDWNGPGTAGTWTAPDGTAMWLTAGDSVVELASGGPALLRVTMDTAHHQVLLNRLDGAGFLPVGVVSPGDGGFRVKYIAGASFESRTFEPDPTVVDTLTEAVDLIAFAAGVLT